MPKGKKSELTVEQKEEQEREKQEKFKELANIRVNRVIQDMTQLHALGGKSYSSTDEDKERIMEVLQDAVDEVKKALYSGGKTITFEL
jgi:hypothetical protein